MGLITWNKPAKVRPTEEHNDRFSSDTGIPGTFVPNMSQEDRLKWKGKIVNRRKPSCHIEIRKSFPSGANLLIIVALKGYSANNGKDEDFSGVRISLNGPAKMSPQEFRDLYRVVEEAQFKLVNLAEERGTP
jgi:hypothetical protein